MAWPERVLITDVVARDGFQDEPRVIPTAQKVRVIAGLLRAGLRSIEVTAFVHPQVVPQLADAEQVVAALPRDSGAVYAALVPNRRGAERALAAGIDEIRLVISASESHNRANVNRSVAESLAELEATARYVAEERPGAGLAAGIAAALGCAFEGFVPVERVLQVVGRLVDAGVGTVFLADTNGMATPRHVRDLLRAARARFPDVEFGLHLHDARGMALANVLVGLDEGITRFDASLGGIGGCPFTPQAAGNVATEDLVHMLEGMGIQTGVDLGVLLEEAKALQAVLGHPVESRTVRAGRSTDLHTLDEVRVVSARDRGTPGRDR